MAHKKAGGSTRNGRDSRSQRLGVKIFGDQHAIAGNIIIKQHGMRWNAGDGVAVGGDNTLFALRDGLVKFQTKMVRKFTGALRATRIVSVAPKAAAPAKPKKK